MEVLLTETLIVFMFGKFNGINLKLKHTLQMLDLAPALLYTDTFLEQRPMFCYLLLQHCMLEWIHCLLVWQWFKMFIQNMQMRSNKQENKRPRKDRKADAPESACFLQDPRPSILCAGASERIWWRPTCEVNVHLRAKESQGEPKTRLD